MTKAELVRFVAEKLEWTSKQSAAIFDLLAATALQETKKNGEFTIPGLGKLVKAQRAARIGRNPQTGESIKIKAESAVKFRVAKAAKEMRSTALLHQVHAPEALRAAYLCLKRRSLAWSGRRDVAALRREPRDQPPGSLP